MVTVCDRCKKPKSSKIIEIKGKDYDLCESCTDDLIKFINNYNKPGFLESLGKEFRYG